MFHQKSYGEGVSMPVSEMFFKRDTIHFNNVCATHGARKIASATSHTLVVFIEYVKVVNGHRVCPLHQ